MATAIPSIACLGVIGRNNNPLHIQIFPSYDPATNTFAPIRTPLQFSLILYSALDVFDLRSRQNTSSGVGLSGDLGLLHAVDERLAAYGFETNTGTKFVAVVDMRGRRIDSRTAASVAGTQAALAAAATAGVVGLREGEMKPVFKAMQTAYIRLLQNPFYDPDEHSPLPGTGTTGGPGKRITNKRFGEDLRRIGEGWTPGVTNLL
ncbi:trafficking protein particle complex subunit 2-like protein [Diplogelasinospora grovesii]|uniref:Trafficking protein particle complex subunit 2-like protein n=1 Tax=Diplogelasinospora grovesii TaxID=303347 RepID=A0AAN6N474_9PEZI|nr:trafficking protein particle complex subunit 2-like protein [Diplogelasinospora grovesii]